MDGRSHILVLEDDPGSRAAIEAALRAAGLHVHAAGSGEEGLALLEAITPDAVLLDLGLPAMSGRQVLGQLRGRLRHVPVIVLTAERETEVAVECMKAGAWDYLVKPVGDVRLLTTLANALRQHALSRTLASLERSALEGLLPGLVGPPAPLEPLLSEIDRVAEGDRAVLICGGPAAEREAVARAIHACSGRAAGLFAVVRCAGQDPVRQAGELFGPDGRGQVAGCDGGTLYLEDVEGLAPPVQERLEAALQLAARARIGAVAEPDFRLLASTAADLPAHVRRGAFRADLYMRLAAAELALPQRSERPEGAAQTATPGGRAQGALPVGESLRLVDLERDAILAALERAAGSRTEASRELGISRATLYRKLKEHGIG